MPLQAEIPALKRALKAKMALDPQYIPDNLAEYTSQSHITDYLGGKVKIKSYSEIGGGKLPEGIDSLIPGPSGVCILLIENEPNSGHWVALLKYDNVVEFFNSYGDPPAHEVHLIPASINRELRQSPRDILDILDAAFDQGRKVIYNKVKLQTLSGDIGTCGKHCILRSLMLKHYGLGLMDYLSFIRYMCSQLGVDADGLVTLLINVE